jgi:phosphatidylserine synthase
MDYLPITFKIIGYALLLITIYCCYEAYYKIKRNKGYIYIAIICFIMLLSLSNIYFESSRSERMERAQQVSDTAISPLIVNKRIVWHLPLVELFLLLAVLKFAIKEEKYNPNQKATGNPAPPDTRA